MVGALQYASAPKSDVFDFERGQAGRNLGRASSSQAVLSRKWLAPPPRRASFSNRVGTGTEKPAMQNRTWIYQQEPFSCRTVCVRV